MFYPDGVIPLNIIHETCRNIAWDRFPGDVSNFEIDPRYMLCAELIFSRFLEVHGGELWVFKAPDILLRSSGLILFRDRFYDGPCPTDIEEAKSALEHLSRGPRIFLTRSMRVNANVADKDAQLHGLEEEVNEMKAFQGALICWKGNELPIDLEKFLAGFVDQDGSEIDGSSSTLDALRKVHEAFREVCPNGKLASGRTWLEIEKKTGWSRRHILRAIDAFSGQNDGQEGAQG